MMDILNILMSESFWAASLRIASPLIFGVLGALLCERAGVLNLGIEGIFVAGAMAGWMAVWLGAGLWGRRIFCRARRRCIGAFARHFNCAARAVTTCIWAGCHDVCHLAQLFYVPDLIARCNLTPAH